MKPPISYYGGKQRMAHRIVPLIPKHTVYVEPFAGGAAVFFAKPWPNVSKNSDYREVINDKDSHLINFYRQLRNNGPELIRRLELTPYSRQEYRESIDLNHDDPIESARRYFVHINQSFSAKLHGGWGRTIFGQNQAASWVNRVARLPEYIDRMKSVHIACDDALNIIKQWDSPQTFSYCDPPYPGTDCGHYKGYTLDDFRALIEALDSCDGSFILSNYEQVNAAIPDDWERYEFKIIASSKKTADYDKRKKAKEQTEVRERTEIVWRRLAKHEPRIEILNLFGKGGFDCFTKGEFFFG